MHSNQQCTKQQCKLFTRSEPDACGLKQLGTAYKLFNCWVWVCRCRRRVFLLGPSHYLATRKCVLSSAQEYTTPLGAAALQGWAWPPSYPSRNYSTAVLETPMQRTCSSCHSVFWCRTTAGCYTVSFSIVTRLLVDCRLASCLLRRALQVCSPLTLACTLS
jgi:hypothetical protein